MSEKTAEIAIIGGSGIYEIPGVENPKRFPVKTPYGKVPKVLIGELGGRRVAFIPRHGAKHTFPPHRINYRANIWALKELGVKRVLATTASGTLSLRFKPGELVLLTQFLDFTKTRPLTFYEGGRSGVVHVDMTEPYCPELRGALSRTARKLGVKLHPRATYACMEGPRFETPAEIRALRKLGADLVGMTNIPECVLARELGICYAAVGIITNYAAGLSRSPLSHAQVLELMKRNIGRTQRLLLRSIPGIPRERRCGCGKAASEGRVKV
jgi:5'-methylthioadenosine phosphorylase